MFAIDGVKLPSNAAKSRSGTRADFEHHACKLEAAAQQMRARHRTEDERVLKPALDAKAAQRLKRLTHDAANFARGSPPPHDRHGARGTVIKSNRTDNQSAKMATDKGGIQGDTGVAAVDAKHQIIVAAQAHGSGAEQTLLMPVIADLKPYLKATSLITADPAITAKIISALSVSAQARRSSPTIRCANATSASRTACGTPRNRRHSIIKRPHRKLRSLTISRVTLPTTRADRLAAEMR